MTDGPPRIFDRRAYRLHRARAGRAGGDGFLVQTAAEQLSERIHAVNRRFSAGLDLGSRTEGIGCLGRHAASWIRAATDGACLPNVAGMPAVTEMNPPLVVVADEEALPFAAQTFDLVTSVLCLHMVNDLPGTLLQIQRILKPDGLFMGALFGGDTLTELRQAMGVAEVDVLGGLSPRIAPFADVRELGGLLQRAGFALPVADVERTIVRYGDLGRLFSDLRMAGETNAMAGRLTHFLPRRLLSATTKEYGLHHADSDGRFQATFDIAYLTAWAPHESQPKALRPGSAKARLADALGTKEHSAGEKPP